MRADRMISRLQEGPVLSVVTGVDRGEDRVLHIPVFPAAGYVEELEGDCFPVGRGLRNHPGAISRIAVVPEEESSGDRQSVVVGHSVYIGWGPFI